MKDFHATVSKILDETKDKISSCENSFIKDVFNDAFNEGYTFCRSLYKDVFELIESMPSEVANKLIGLDQRGLSDVFKEDPADLKKKLESYTNSSYKSKVLSESISELKQNGFSKEEILEALSEMET